MASITVSIYCHPRRVERSDMVTLLHRVIHPPNCWDQADTFIAKVVKQIHPHLDAAAAHGQAFCLALDITWADAEGCRLEIPLRDPTAQRVMFNWGPYTLARQVRGFYLKLIDQAQAEPCGPGRDDYPDPEALLEFLRAHEVGG